LKIKATPLYNRAAEILPSPGDRAWVRESGLEGAGLALESVNDKGWDLVCPCAFEATWNGGPSAEDIEIRLEGPQDDGPAFVQSQHGNGRLTFHPGHQFQVEGEHLLWMRGPVNRPKDGLQPLESIVDTSLLPRVLAVQWQFTRPNRPIRFEKGEPYATLLPYPRGDECTEIDVAPVGQTDQDLALAPQPIVRKQAVSRPNTCAYSVIVPTLNEGPNLWYTLHCFLMLWDAQGVQDHELIVVDSGSTDKTLEFLNRGSMSKHVRLVETDASGPGPVRQVGAAVANGEVLFFFDAHVLVPPGFFVDALAAIKRPEVWERLGSMHFPVRWDWGGSASTYYKLTLEQDFWGTHGVKRFDEVSEVAVAIHCATAVRRDHYETVGGYHTSQIQYGGDECYLDLKFGRYGYRNYTCPDTYVLHCSQRRLAYSFSRGGLFRNNVISAYSVGGSYWARKVLDHHLNEGQMGGDELERLYVEAIRIAQHDHDLIRATAPYTLEQVLGGFEERGVPH
jgi:glycosyltransferase involved in cell wall biosynthesis